MILDDYKRFFIQASVRGRHYDYLSHVVSDKIEKEDYYYLIFFKFFLEKKRPQSGELQNEFFDKVLEAINFKFYTCLLIEKVIDNVIFLEDRITFSITRKI